MTAPQDQAVEVRRNRWHQSTLDSLLSGCSFQHYLIYIKGLDQGPKPYAQVGTAYHSVVEAQERARMDGTPEPTAAEMQEHGRELLSEQTDQPDLLERLAAALKNYEKDIRPYLRRFEPLSLEPEFDLPLVDGAKNIGGYIDGVYRDPIDGQIFIIDHKTAKSYDRWRNADSHRHQAAMYSVALTLDPRFPDITALPEMRYLVVRTSLGTRSNFEGSRILACQPDMLDVQELAARIRQAEAKVEAWDFQQNQDWPLCSEQWCFFYARCVTNQELPAQFSLEKAQRFSQHTHQAQQEIGESNV